MLRVFGEAVCEGTIAVRDMADDFAQNRRDRQREKQIWTLHGDDDERYHQPRRRRTPPPPPPRRPRAPRSSPRPPPPPRRKPPPPPRRHPPLRRTEEEAATKAKDIIMVIFLSQRMHRLDLRPRSRVRQFKTSESEPFLLHRGLTDRGF